MSRRSFIYGILLTSIVWIVCLYMYMRILQNESSLITNHYNEHQMKNTELVNSGKLIRDVNKDIKDMGVVRNQADQKRLKEGYKDYAFNILKSDAIGNIRNIPDTRNQLCQSQTYPANSQLPKASVIICFYNEHYTTLLRTVHSVLERTHKQLLHEIVIVDDYSDSITLHSEIERYIDQNLNDNVRIFKTERREGLIRAKIFGAQKATGDVLVFLDSHVEVNEDWLRPLLAPIARSPKTVTVPVIDIINPDSMVYSASPLVRGGFNWGLHYKWDTLPKGSTKHKEDLVKAIKSPTMAGGLFAMNRQYFFDLGAYDDGMDVWGGENIEISFRIWMCGGELLIIPCSRVGHIFRRRRPYRAEIDTMLRNSLRVANVWMDDYKQYFYAHNKNAKSANYGDVSARVALRNTLKCHDFKWYLTHVYPEMTLPTDNDEQLSKKQQLLNQAKFQPWHSRKRNYIDAFQLQLSGTDLCVGVDKESLVKGAFLVLKTCSKAKKQVWYETDKNELVLSRLLCLQTDSKGVRLMKCHEMGGDQEWRHSGENTNPIFNVGAGTCLGVDEAKELSRVKMVLCNDETFNKWSYVK